MSFNTSHVTLYPKDRFGLVNVITFQYISCYSLSKGRWNLNLRMKRFNTSHVTLYLTAATGQKITVVFQYISCYSLSAKNWAMDHLECEFQYISCYSLSKCIRLYESLFLVSIHLMLLFICAAAAPYGRFL